MTTKIIKISPETLRTLYLRKEDNEILRTEFGNRIWIDRIVPENFKPVRLYDIENQINENKREILLVDSIYLNQISKEFNRLINE
jgi:hypothetical protein